MHTSIGALLALAIHPGLAAAGPDYSAFARLELARSRRAAVVIDHGDDRVSRVAAGGGALALVQLVPDGEGLRKYSVPIATEPARVMHFRTAAVPSRWPDAEYAASTPWVTIKLANDVDGIETTMTLAAGRRPVLDPDGQWRARPVRLQRFLIHRRDGERVDARLAPADPDGVYRILRVTRGEYEGDLRARPAYGDILGFTTNGRRMQVTFADGVERNYPIKELVTVLRVNHRSKYDKSRPALVPALERAYPARDGCGPKLAAPSAGDSPSVTIFAGPHRPSCHI